MRRHPVSRFLASHKSGPDKRTPDEDRPLNLEEDVEIPTFLCKAKVAGEESSAKKKRRKGWNKPSLLFAGKTGAQEKTSGDEKPGTEEGRNGESKPAEPGSFAPAPATKKETVLGGAGGSKKKRSFAFVGLAGRFGAGTSTSAPGDAHAQGGAEKASGSASDEEPASPPLADLTETSALDLQFDPAALALYIHWPFCVSKCPYCDFTSYATDPGDEAALAESYVAEIAHYASLLPERRIGSVFFGGGTPSLMRPQTLERILNALRERWAFDDACEISLEANPVTAEIDKFEAFKAAGVNRLSLGVQSLNDDRLRFLGRAHSADEAKRALYLAAGLFPRFSFDLMYGFFDQTVEEWEEELDRALVFGARHMSLYQLTVEPHTAFHLRQTRGEKLAADPSVAAALYDLTLARLEEAGLPFYEISNHAAPGQECRHNMTYWTYGDYVGIGPAAHGRLALPDERLALANHASVRLWKEQVEARGHGCVTKERLTQDEAAREALLMGLRLRRGIDVRLWKMRLGSSFEEAVDLSKWKVLERQGLLAHEGAVWRAREAGLKRLNAVLREIAK